MLQRFILTVFLSLFATVLQAQTFTTSAGRVVVEPVVRGLDTPWGFGFLDDGSLLITERAGRLLHVKSGVGARPVKGVPDVLSRGQGGLLDVVPAKDFAQSKQVFITYSQPADGGSRTAVISATFDADTPALRDVTQIFRQKDAMRDPKHFGSRLVEALDGTLYITTGDRGARPSAQDRDGHNGKIIRINRDGSAPSDNPFANGGGAPEVWSYGHRNPQGATLDARGRLWTVEHGPKGGDEINQPIAGRNYGWPVISYGTHYSGGKVGDGTAKSGMEQPKFYWDPSIAPSGMMIYNGDLFAAWKGDVFVGSLKFNMISRVSIDDTLSEKERLFQGKFSRIRDIREAPDGTIWFLSVGDGALYRMRPAG